MGLDNGFICKNIKRNEIPSYVRLPWDCRDEDIEIAYFRKCWGIRGEIIRLLHVKDDEYKYGVVGYGELSGGRRAFCNMKIKEM